MSQPPFTVGILGPTLARRGETELVLGGPRRRTLVARLAIEAGRALAPERIIEDLWEGDAPRGAVATLHSHVSAVRKVVGADRLVRRADGYALVVRGPELDVTRFESALAHGSSAARAGDVDSAAIAYRDALGQWRGPALADARNARWAAATIAHLEELRLSAEEALLTVMLDAGEDAEVVARAEALVVDHPLRERLWAHLLVALYRTGRQAESLRAYRRVSVVLVEELGLGPGSQLRSLEQAILAQDDARVTVGDGADGVPARTPQAGAMAPVDDHRLELAPAGSDGTAGFRGRRDELHRLTGQLKVVARGGRGVAVISGEPGIGKTRLAHELAVRARREEALVLHGRCDEDLGLAYQPYREILDALSESMGDAFVQRHVDDSGGALAHLLSSPRPDAPTSPPLRSPEDRYVLFAAVLRLLVDTARHAPLVLVLDDLHWAADPTVLLTRFVITAPSARRIQVVVTCRDGGIASDGPLARLLALLDRDAASVRLVLGGLHEHDIVDMCASAMEVSHAGAVAVGAQVWALTDGNPFFALELIRSGAALVSTGLHTVDVPRQVRDVIATRVGRLGAGCRPVLEVAGVAGSEFDLDVLATALDHHDVLDAVEQAATAQLVVPAGPDRFRFSHALVREAVYENLSPARRAQLHGRVALALERATNGPARIGEIAGHWARAGAGGRRRAAETAAQAGRRALDQLAPNDAVRWYSSALDLLEGPDDDTSDLRGDVLLGLGEAQRQSGDGMFRDTLLRAAAWAGARGDVERLVRAALANTRGFFSLILAVDHERVAVLEAALQAVGERQPAQRAQLLGLLAAEIVYVPQNDGRQRRELSDEAIDLARRSGDPAALLHLFNLRAATVDDDPPFPFVHEALVLADRVGEPTGVFWASLFAMVAGITAGRADEVDRHLDQVLVLAERISAPTIRWMAAVAATWVATLHGRLDDAEKLVALVLDLGTSSGQPDAELTGDGLLADIRWHRGDADQLIEEYEAVHDPMGSDADNLASTLAQALVATGANERARPLLAAAAAKGFSGIRRDAAYLAVLGDYAEVAAALDDVVAASTLYEILLPVASRVGFDGFGANGSTEHPLGVLALTRGDAPLADRHFEQALAVHRSLEAPFHVARTCTAWGASLLGRASTLERQRGRALVEEAVAIAAEHGYVLVERLARGRLAGVGVAAVAAGGPLRSAS